VTVSDMPSKKKRKKGSRGRWYAGASLTLLLLLGGAAFLHVGNWLVVSDELAPSAAIVVLSGEVPFRAMEAADIYNAGWAPEIWLTEDRDPRVTAAVAPLGIELLTNADESRRVLEAMGVPAEVIHVIPAPVRNTADEMREVSKRLFEMGGGTAIIVSPEFHTRRVRTLWRRLTGDAAGAIVRPATRDPYDGARWWRGSHDIGLCIQRADGSGECLDRVARTTLVAAVLRSRS